MVVVLLVAAFLRFVHLGQIPAVLEYDEAANVILSGEIARGEAFPVFVRPYTGKEALKREYGRHITCFGAVNTQRLPFLTPAQVAAEVKRCIDMLGKGGGYICGPDHHIKPDVRAANAVALFEAARGYRGPGYTVDA